MLRRSAWLATAALALLLGQSQAHAAAQPSRVERAPEGKSVGERIELVRERIEKMQSGGESHPPHQLSQWFNFPNFPNFPNFGSFPNFPNFPND
jgi:hypothetical protein